MAELSVVVPASAAEEREHVLDAAYKAARHRWGAAVVDEASLTHVDDVLGAVVSADVPPDMPFRRYTVQCEPAQPHTGGSHG